MSPTLASSDIGQVAAWYGKLSSLGTVVKEARTDRKKKPLTLLTAEALFVGDVSYPV